MSGIEMMVVEDVDVVEAEPPQALIEAGEEILARPEIAIGTGPHVPTGLGRDDELVAIAGGSPRGGSARSSVSALPYGGP